jgi:hypothetical protein
MTQSMDTGVKLGVAAIREQQTAEIREGSLEKNVRGEVTLHHESMFKTCSLNQT